MNLPTLTEYLAEFKPKIDAEDTPEAKAAYRWKLAEIWAGLVEREFAKLERERRQPRYDASDRAHMNPSPIHNIHAE